MTLAARAARVAALFAVVVLSTAHVGSPDTWFEGDAGPYKVRVLIRAPAVIPARAEIVVRILGCSGGAACPVTAVTATPRIWNGGEHGAPPPDHAARVPGDSSLWSLQLWIMRQGSYAVLVAVTGAAGTGTATVPYTAVATNVLGMNPRFGLLLAVLGLFLAVGMITIVGAGTREATLAPGTEPDDRALRRSRRARIIAAIIIVVVLMGGRAWWNVEQRSYADALYHPTVASIAVRRDSAGAVLRMSLDSIWSVERGWSPLVPDHGKLMHLFLIRDDQGAMAHLHPVGLDSLRYESRLPPLPAGHYRAFADVVHESGFAETIVSSATVDSAPPRVNSRLGSVSKTDDDDAAFEGTPTGDRFALGDGSSLAWERRGAARAGEDAQLHFTLRDAGGHVLDVEPYLGMAAHAVVVRSDDSVFVHLHPAGTASLAAQRALEAFTPADSARGAVRDRVARADSGMVMNEAMRGDFTFPYAFPKPGRYRVWVQLRHGGIRTAVFDAEVR